MPAERNVSANSGVKVLDSWILVGWMKEEPAAAERMEQLWRMAAAEQIRLALNVVNLGEVFYLTAKTRSLEAAEWAAVQLESMPLEIRPASNSLVLQAARLKSCHSISYADAFAVATAIREQAPLVTGDPEIQALAARGILELEWVE